MTPLIDAADQADISTPPPQAPVTSRKRSFAGVLTDPRVRLGAGALALLITAMAVRRDRVGPYEAAAFRAVNDLPDRVYPPAWVVMQLGTLCAAPAAAGVAWLAGDRPLAGRLLAGGTSAWALSKVVKRMVRRPKPAMLLPGTRRRGREAAGLGYLSGHAGVAVALGAAAFPRLDPAVRALTLATVSVVGLTRIYVGAHLPLDVAGGAALGLAIDAAIALANGRTARPAPGGKQRAPLSQQSPSDPSPAQRALMDSGKDPAAPGPSWPKRVTELPSAPEQRRNYLGGRSRHVGEVAVTSA
jgi:glycosyltransferase 2 family protein